MIRRAAVGYVATIRLQLTRALDPYALDGVVCQIRTRDRMRVIERYLRSWVSLSLPRRHAGERNMALESSSGVHYRGGARWVWIRLGFPGANGR